MDWIGLDWMGLDISGWGEVEGTYSKDIICLQVAFQFYFIFKNYKVESNAKPSLIVKKASSFG